jgi:transposase-like protein
LGRNRYITNYTLQNFRYTINGYKPLNFRTKYGELELSKPQFREFPFGKSVFEKYSRVKKAILTAVAESYLQGVSTRRMGKIMTVLEEGEI